ncbi:uncharacterized protein LOC106161923 [Lingula anatina]|uniref:Uncharacterized protein LOC106161923 n=1 Tax=Lingula anatina TaxID=7574 RepID=A0A1S3I9B4_LINAN|nr:uncharacterized protein LOC106161923 [Lingula anatina]|eukprot:XP_013394456.1 uncharacterized protein LOC106161923 [Lingula anatina]
MIVKGIFFVAVCLSFSNGQLDNAAYPDELIYTEMKDGVTFEAGFSTKADVSPDSVAYPVKEIAEVCALYAPTEKIDAEEAIPADLQDLSEAAFNEKVASIFPIGVTECPEYYFRILPYWVRWQNKWFPVIRCGMGWWTWMYCPPFSCYQTFNYSKTLNFKVCARCTTEWGWRQVYIWTWYKPMWVWIRVPTGCCCGLAWGFLC